MSATLPTLTDSGLDDVYQWIGNIPLSRPVRNISKDLSDGGSSLFLKKPKKKFKPLSPRCRNYIALFASLCGSK